MIMLKRDLSGCLMGDVQLTFGRYLLAVLV